MNRLIRRGELLGTPPRSPAQPKYRIIAKCYDKRGRLLSKAENSYTKTHPLMSFYGKLVGQPERTYLHAELAALLKCGDVSPYKIHVARYKRDGSPGTAKPCAICERALLAWGVKELSYTTG